MTRQQRHPQFVAMNYYPQPYPTQAYTYHRG
jgi:hypothetical protein